MIGSKSIANLWRYRTTASASDKDWWVVLQGIPLRPGVRRLSAALIAGVAVSALAQLLQPIDPRTSVGIAAQSELRGMSLFVLWSWIVALALRAHAKLRDLGARWLDSLPRLHSWLQACVPSAVLAFLAAWAFLGATKYSQYTFGAALVLWVLATVLFWSWEHPRVRAWRTLNFGPEAVNRERNRQLVIAASCLVALALMLLNARFQPRHYHAVHLALGLAALYCVQQAVMLSTLASGWHAVITSAALSVVVFYLIVVSPMSAGAYSKLMERPLNVTNVRMAVDALTTSQKPTWFLPVPSEGLYQIYKNAREIPNNGRDENNLGGDLNPPLPSPLQRAPDARCIEPGKIENIFWLSFDALRGDVVERKDFATLAPTISGLVNQGIYFSGQRTTSARTETSLIAEIKGDFEWRTFDDAESNALLALHRAGLYTLLAGVVTAPPEFLEPVDDHYFFWWDGFEPSGTEAGYYERLTRYLAELSELKRPFFMFTHYGDMHAPYPHGKSENEFERYVETLPRVDGHVRRVLELLEQHRLLDETVLVINGDHGEEFGEHGGTQHARTLYDEVIRTPLIFHIPGAKLGPKHVDNVVSSLDIQPTLFDIMGRPKPSRLRGDSLYPAICGEDIPHDVAVGRSFDPSPFVEPMSEMQLLVSYVMKGEEKIILDHLTGGLQIYDLRTDPGETNNLYMQDPSRDQPLLKLLDQWLHEMNSFGEYPKVTKASNKPAQSVRTSQGDRFVLRLNDSPESTFTGFYPMPSPKEEAADAPKTKRGRWTMGHGRIRIHDRRFMTREDCLLSAEVAGGSYELAFNSKLLPPFSKGKHIIPRDLISDRLDHEVELISEPVLRGKLNRPFGAMLRELVIECPSFERGVRAATMAHEAP